MVNQTPMLLGFPPCDSTLQWCGGSTTISKLWYIVLNWGNTNWATLTVSVCALFLLWSLNTLKKSLAKRCPTVSLFLPPNLIVLGIFLVLSYALDFSGKNISILGEISVGMGSVSVPEFDIHTLYKLVQSCIIPAATMAIILFTQSSVIGKQYATKHNYSIDPNQEMIALGLANITGSFFNTLPACGSFPRSKVNDMAGAATPMAGASII